MKSLFYYVLSLVPFTSASLVTATLVTTNLANAENTQAYRCVLPLAKNKIREKQVLMKTKAPTLLQDSLKLSLVQYPVQNGMQLSAFKEKIRNYVVDAHQSGSQLVVLPELMSIDLISRNGDEKTQLEQIARDVTPLYIEFQKALSRELNITILGGSLPRLFRKKVRNTAVLTFPDQRTVLQDKLFLTPDEVRWGWEPGETLHLIDSPWGKTAILICYDCQFALISTLLSKYAPDLILVPSMTGDEGRRRVKYAGMARAIEHYAYVAITGTIDSVTANRDYSSQALIVPPQDAGFPPLLAEVQKDVPQTLNFTLDMKKLREHKAKAEIFSGRDQGLRNTPIEIQSQ